MMFHITGKTWLLLHGIVFGFILFGCVGIHLRYVLFHRRVEKINHRGRQLLKSGQRERAIEEFRKAIRINARDAVSHSNLGFALYLGGDWKEAFKEFDAAMRLMPVMAEPYFGRGQIYRHFLDLEHRAEEDFAMARKLNPEIAEIIADEYGIVPGSSVTGRGTVAQPDR